MTEELELIRDEAEEKMEKAVYHLEDELSHLRAARANPLLLDGISVDYYGAMTPLSQVSNINTPDAKSILIQPWEKTMLGVIEKAILAANIGMTPINNGEVIRINVPPLTEERRHRLSNRSNRRGDCKDQHPHRP
jgi:ribosome recycling factor